MACAWLMVPILLLCACATAVPRVTPELVATARVRDPGVDGEELTRGREIFTTRCNTCHSLPLPASFSESQWSKYVASMGPKAKLAREQQEDVLRYVLAARSSR